jgi:hypothetical protein
MRHIRVHKFFLVASGLGLLVLAFVACNPVENKTKSASLLVVENLLGSDLKGNEVNFLQSDVIFQNADTGAVSWMGDSAKVTLSASTLDPDPKLGVSSYEDVQVTRYVISYIRPDGKNVQGKDVPYSFEGNLSVLVRIGQSSNASFVIVREVAKQEPPLVNLLNADRGDVLNMTIRVDFYGHDMANKAVQATGYLPVFFANYGN